MLLTSICIGIGLWCFYMAIKFYRRADWEAPAVYTPDLGALRKREAELLHVQEILEEAHAQGKLSTAMLEEYHRFCDEELAGIRAVTQPPPPSRPN